MHLLQLKYSEIVTSHCRSVSKYCWFIHWLLFYVPFENLSLRWWGQHSQQLAAKSVYTVFDRERFFLIVPCMLWNLTSVLWSYQEPIPSLQTNVRSPHTLLPNLGLYSSAVVFDNGYTPFCRVLIRTEVMMSIEAHLLIILHLSISTKKGGEN